jgi:hypothetical protein
VWAQATPDGLFACSWTPQHPKNASGAGGAGGAGGLQLRGEGPRYPLQVSTGPNGTVYDQEMLNVNGEVYRRWIINTVDN